MHCFVLLYQQPYEWCTVIVPFFRGGNQDLEMLRLESKVGDKLLREFGACDNLTPEFLSPVMPSCWGLMEGMEWKGSPGASRFWDHGQTRISVKDLSLNHASRDLLWPLTSCLGFGSLNTSNLEQTLCFCMSGFQYHLPLPLNLMMQLYFSSVLCLEYWQSVYSRYNLPCLADQRHQLSLELPLHFSADISTMPYDWQTRAPCVLKKEAYTILLETMH